jgi:protein arginine N-methyltransferase 1
VIDLLDEHRHYVTDEVRIDGFRRALAATVRPGDVVLDLGAGTGVLGLLACAAGARRVYAVDDGPMIHVAREVARSSPHADRIVHIPSHSDWMTLPEPVDVIVADQMGYFGLEAGLADAVPTAAARCLAPGGRIVPAAVTLWVAPVSMPDLDTWGQVMTDIDFSAVARLEQSTPRPVTAPAAALLGEARTIGTVDTATGVTLPITATVRTSCRNAGRLDGLLGWFEATLARGVVVTNGPGAPGRIRRPQLFMPVDVLPVREHDTIELSVTLTAADGATAWSVTVDGPDGVRRGRCRRTIVDGLVLAPDHLRATAPSHRPTLTREGEARAEVLRRCDGRHTVAAIEQAVHEGFPDVFPSPAAAGAFVASVLRRHAR